MARQSPSKSIIAFGSALALTAAIGVGSQANAQEVIDLGTWNYEPLQQGWSAEDMIGAAEIYDQDNEVIGELEDLIIGPDGKIKRAIIEAGGFLDIGDTHFSYPWDQVRKIGEGSFQVMLDEDNIDDYSVFGDVEDEPAAGRNWRISELINDYAYVGGDVRYGWVDDVIIGRDDTIQAIVVYPDMTYRRPGPYALPYYGTGFEPGADRYTIPYTADEIAELDVFVLPQQVQPQSEQKTGQQPAGKQGQTQQK